MSAKRKTASLTLDRYDWAELFAQFRANPSAPHVARVRRILELLKAITPGLKGPAGMRVHTELNSLMREYQWHSRILLSAQGVIEVLSPPLELTGATAWEYAAVRWLLNLLQGRGELDLVHLCEMHETRPKCAGWYYGRSNKGFCSDACKQYRYDSQDAVKARRARNAEHNRAYRLNLKREAAKAKKGVGFKGDYRLRASKAGGVKKGRKPVAKGQK